MTYTPGPVTCASCCETFTGSGARSRFCSDACRFGVATCVQCGTVFHARPDNTGRLCSVPCGHAYRKASNAKIPTKVCNTCGEVKDKGEFYRGRASCKPCVIARNTMNPNKNANHRADHQRHKVERNASRVERQRNEDGSRQARWNKTPAGRRSKADASARRRAAKMGAACEKYARLDVYERDGGICQLCEMVVDLAVLWPDPQAFSIDHIVPLILGGHDNMGNVQTSHLACNIAKGAKPMEKIL